MTEMRAGQELLLIGIPGLLGTRTLLESWEEELCRRFSRRYLREERRKLERLPLLSFREDRIMACGLLLHREDKRAVTLSEKDLIAKENAGEIFPGELGDLIPGYAKDYGLSALISVEDGGVLDAIWRLCEGKKGGRSFGCRFSYGRIPFLSLSIELCELFSQNPFRLPSGNCCLMALERGYALSEKLGQCGVRSSVIGSLSEDRKRLRTDGIAASFLTKGEVPNLFSGR